MDPGSPNDNSANNIYVRMNSEVIEKPSHFEQSGSECEESLEILALLSDNSPLSEQEVCVLESGGQSPYSSSKGDGSNAGDLEGLGDELDEGFDEEFEFYDNDEVKDTANNPDSIDLNDKDLQRLLLEQSTMPLANAGLLDDFDLGVDVFDSDPGFQAVDQPCSPYHHHSPSPVSVANSDVMHPDPPYSDGGSFYPTSSSFIDFEPPIHSYSNSTVTTTQPGVSWGNPTLSSVNLLMDVMDLNEASRLMTTNLPDLIPVSESVMQTPTSPHTPMSTMSDRASPGPANNSSRMARSLSPAPYSHHPPPTPPSQSGACYVPTSEPPSPTVFNCVTFGKLLDEQAVIDMPFHKFKKILDDTNVSETDKDKLKCVRRRGKNKVAAKNCRQKKVTMICGLQQEIDQMRAAKARLDLRTRTLEQEIACLKQQCARRYNSLKR